MSKVTAGAAILMFATMTVGAHATTIIPDAVGVVTVIANTPDTTVLSGTLSASLPGASGSIVLSPFVDIQAQVTDGSTAGQGSTVALTYYFSVIGGTPGTAVPVDVATSLTTMASAEPSPGSTAFYGFSSISIGSAGKTVCTDGTQCTSRSFAGTIPLTADAGAVETVHLELVASGNPGFVGTAFASADPYIFVDPGFADASDYSIAVSDGVGNSPLVTPLPAALPLFASSLGMAGLLALRKRAKLSRPA